MRLYGKKRTEYLTLRATLRGITLLWLVLPGTPAMAQPAPPAPGVDLPPAFYQRLQENPRAFRFERAWFAVAQRAQRNRALSAEKPGSGANLRVSNSMQVSGTMRVPVLLGKFANTAISPYPPERLQQALFDGPWPTGTLTDYYREASYGHLTLTGQVAGWVTLSEADTFYEAGSNGIGPDAKTGRFLREVLDASDPLIDFGQFDNDGPDGLPNSGDDDGFVDFVTFVHPEAGGECGSRNIWSHRWTYSAWWGESYATRDPAANGGVIRVQDYIIAPGVNCDGGGLIEKGIFCHEFGHAFGLPDLYDPDQSSEGVGNWCLMAAGNWNSPDSPAHLSAWCKVQLGWVLPREILLPDSTGAVTPPGEVVLPPAYAEAAAVKILLDAAGEEYFLVENREVGGFDVHLPGEGLLIWHVDDRKPGNTEEWYPGMDPARHYRVALEPADGAWDLERRRNRGDAGDPFREGRFTCHTRPGSDSYLRGATGLSVRPIAVGDGMAVAEIDYRCESPAMVVQPSHIFLELAAGGSAQASLHIRNDAGPEAPPLRWQLMERPAGSDSFAAGGRSRSGVISSSPAGGLPAVGPSPQKGQRDLRTAGVPVLLSGGTDAFGYRWQTSAEPGGPRYDWVDIAATGIPLDLKDDDFIDVNLPFLFPFYGQLYDGVKISSNGYLTFGANGREYRHQLLPDPALPNGLIAGLWRDLNPALGGRVYYQTDLQGDGWIVQYDDIPTYRNDARFTFQIRLAKNGAMRLQYQQTGGDAIGTVGIEDADGATGLSVAFNAPLLQDGLAILLAPEDVLPWLAATVTAGEILPGDAQEIILQLDAGALPSGVHRGALVLHSNDPAHRTVSVPVQVTVAPQLAVSVRAFLEGAVLTGRDNHPAAMRSDLAGKGVLPLRQPYRAAPWQYPGNEELAEIPPGAVDWVLVHLCRDAPGTDVVATRAGLLMSDGSITAPGEPRPLLFENVPDGNYFVRLVHRNHLSVISRTAVGAVQGMLRYDFTNAADRAAGYQPLVAVGAGGWALRAGDANGDGGIDLRDKNLVWRLQNGQANGYFSADFNLDGRVDGADLDRFWRKNNGTAAQAGRR